MATTYLTREQKTRLESALKEHIDYSFHLWDTQGVECVNPCMLAEEVQRLQWLEQQGSIYD